MFLFRSYEQAWYCVIPHTLFYPLCAVGSRSAGHVEIWVNMNRWNLRPNQFLVRRDERTRSQLMTHMKKTGTWKDAEHALRRHRDILWSAVDTVLVLKSLYRHVKSLDIWSSVYIWYQEPIHKNVFKKMVFASYLPFAKWYALTNNNDENKNNSFFLSANLVHTLSLSILLANFTMYPYYCIEE